MHTATYSPQDDKIRLFFDGRIPKEEWNALKAAGFSWTMKQASDMVALWTPAREDIALEMCGEIGDEDQPREDRAADRADRFEGYMEKREGEAVALADGYDAGPSVHGHQSLRRAERSAARHDRLAARAVTQWGKAEYWQSRTAGVIAHALHLERADVRHRRIKGLESDARRMAQRTDENGKRWAAHIALRLGYEVQMLQAQGGTMADVVEMVAGGWIGSRQIVKLSKDRAGRVSKVYFAVPKGADYWTRFSACVAAERIAPGSYRAPTAEDLDALKANKPKLLPLINERSEGCVEMTKAEYDRAAVAQYAYTRKVGGARVRHTMTSGCSLAPVFITDMPEKKAPAVLAAVAP